MPRDGNGVYSAPAGTTAVTGTTIESTKYNAFANDLVSDANGARPVTAGGTGSTSKQAAVDTFFDGTTEIEDTNLRIVDPDDATKVVVFDVGEITTATTRTVTIPDKSGTMAMTDDIPPFDATAAKTSAYTVLTSDQNKTILCDATSAAFTVTLPAAATAGDGFVVTIIKTDSSENVVTIDGNSSETINGATTRALFLQHQALTLICNGTAWSIQSNFSEWTEVAPKATTSGTEIDWADIPAGVTDIEMWFNGVSGASTDDFLVQLGTGGSPTTSGYSSGSGVAGSNVRVSATTGMALFQNVADGSTTGLVQFHRTTGNTWISSHSMIDSASNGTGLAGAGVVSLAGALDNVRLRSLGGSQAFDAGSVQLRYR